MRLIIEIIVLTAMFALFTWFFAIEYMELRISWFYWLCVELTGFAIYTMLITGCVRHDYVRYLGEDN